MAFTSLESRGT